MGLSCSCCLKNFKPDDTEDECKVVANNEIIDKIINNNDETYCKRRLYIIVNQSIF